MSVVSETSESQRFRRAVLGYVFAASCRHSDDRAGGARRPLSLGTEKVRLFRTKLDGGGFFSNHFGVQLQELVRAVRAVYSGPLTYDMD